MTKLEKIGLIIAIPSGLVTILGYLEKIDFSKFLKENLEWLPSAMKSTLIWLYENIILLEVNIWILFILIFAIYKLNIFIKKNNIHNSIDEDVKPKTLLEIFNEFDEDTQKVFGYIMYCQEKNIRCTKQSINRELKDTDISNLEQEKIVENFINDNIVEPDYNVMDPTSYTLSKYGSDIAVSLVKNSKNEKKKI